MNRVFSTFLIPPSSVSHTPTLERDLGYQAPRLVGVTSDFTNFNKVRISSSEEDLAGYSPFAIDSMFLLPLSTWSLFSSGVLVTMVFDRIHVFPFFSR